MFPLVALDGSVATSVLLVILLPSFAARDCTIFDLTVVSVMSILGVLMGIAVGVGLETVTFIVAVAVRPAASVAVTVTVPEAPAVTPVMAKAVRVLSCVAYVLAADATVKAVEVVLTVHETIPLFPDAVNETFCVIPTPTVTDVVAGVIVSVPVVTVMLIVAVAVCPAASVAVTVTLYVPAVTPVTV